ncbi:MAG: aromatic ring-hydroxylating oxygenase subunit alpha [Deinococcales bacterium]
MLKVDQRIERAATLPATFYKDPAMFERCKDAVFARSWQFIGDTDGLKAPGSTKPFTLLEGCLDEPLLLTRDMNDTLHAMSNVCTHRGMLVCETGGVERFLRCRYHGRRFGLDGSFTSMPEFEEVEDFPRASDSLPKIALETWDKLAFVSLSPSVPLETILAPIKARLDWLPLREFYYDPSRARDYIVRANWALYCDNYLEGFHIPYIHASLNAAIDYGNYTTEHYDWCNLQLGVASSGETAFELPRSSLDFGKNIAAYYYWVFPNLMLNFYPWGLSINVVRPLAHDRCKVSFIPYVWRSELLESGAGAGLDRVEREDEVVVEAVQRGVRSRFYDRGRFSVVREACVHHFHRLLSGALQ